MSNYSAHTFDVTENIVVKVIKYYARNTDIKVKFQNVPIYQGNNRVRKSVMISARNTFA